VPRLHEEGRDLPAMVRLVVEQLGDAPPERAFVHDVFAGVAEVCRELLGAERQDPVFDLVVRLFALGSKFLEACVKLLVERTNAPGPSQSLWTGAPVNRPIQTRSARSRWLSVAWIDLKNAARSCLRSSSLSCAATAYSFSFIQRL
jgi:hypothetical protein